MKKYRGIVKKSAHLKGYSETFAYGGGLNLFDFRGGGLIQ